MTSQFKVQGSLKGIAMIAAALAFSAASLQAQAAVRVVATAGMRTPIVAKPVYKPTPPAPVVVVKTCQRGGPGVTPC